MARSNDGTLGRVRLGAVPLTLLVVAATSAGCELLFPLDGDDGPPPPSDGAPPPGDGPGSDGPGPAGDARTDAALPVGCPPQYVPVGETWYRFEVATSRPWPEAADVCANDQPLAGPGWYTHLAVISETTEQTQLLAHVGSTPWVWIGYSDRNTENLFQWVTLEDPTAMPMWLPGQPDNGSGDQNCVRLGAAGLDDNFCTVSHPYVCECDAFMNQPSHY
jgi:hypothetical protein